MTTIEITDIADVQDGDIVTLRWKEEAGVTVTLEGPARDSAVDGYVITSARFVSATREVPDHRPESVYMIQKRGGGGWERAWCYQNAPHEVGFVDGEGDCWAASELTSIKPVPDDAEALRDEVERLRAARTVPTREQAVAAIEKRLSWASIHWGVEHLHPDALPEIAGAVLGVVERGGTS